MTTGEFLKQKRTKLNLTQKTFAQRIGYSAGQYVSNWERGTCTVPIKQMKAVTKVLKLGNKEKKELVTNFVRDYKATLSDAIN